MISLKKKVETIKSINILGWYGNMEKIFGKISTTTQISRINLLILYYNFINSKLCPECSSIR